MGDRTSVELTIRKDDQNKFENLCDDFDEKFEGERPPDEVALVEYTFYEVNYASLEIEQTLKEKKIPYDKHWKPGGEYNAGTEYHRVDANGKPIIKEFAEDTEGMVALDDVARAFDLCCVDKFIEQMRLEFLVISWKDQDVILSRLNQ